MNLLTFANCSFGYHFIKKKEMPDLLFNNIKDLTLDINKKVRLNYKVKIYHSHGNYFKCDRVLSNVVLVNVHDLKNVLLNKQPKGYNPIITSSKKEYKIYSDFFIVTYDDSEQYVLFGTMPTEDELYITYCDYFDGVNKNLPSSDKFGNFYLVSGNPIFNETYTEIQNTCSFLNEQVTSLMNTTIYIAIQSIDETDFILTDGNTKIIIENNKMCIKSSDDKYTTVPYQIDGSIILVCTITPIEIRVFTNKNLLVPKSGEYSDVSFPNVLTLTCMSCLLYAINIHDGIDSSSRIEYEVTLLSKYI